MAANTLPIYTKEPDIQWSPSILKTANTARDGTGTVLTAFTASADGAYLQKIRFRAIGTNVATVARVWINNGSDPATAANNILFEELTLPATTASEAAQLTVQDIVLGFPLPAGYKLTVAVGTTVAAGYYVSVLGGKY